MWSICRVDHEPGQDPDIGTYSLFEVQAAYRKSDLDIAAARQSGFVGPDDELVIVSPSGKVREVP